MEKFIIDRFEGNMAVLERVNGETVDVPKSVLPAHVSEGDVLSKSNNVYIVDKEQTNKLKKEIKNLMDKLFV